MTIDQSSLIWAILMQYKNVGLTFMELHGKLKRAHNIRLDECFSENMALEGWLVSQDGDKLFPCRDNNGDYVDYGVPKLFEAE